MTSIIGTAIKQERKKQKLTQKQLGDLIGKSGESIKKYENGFTSISTDILHDIADALNLSVNDFYYHPDVSIDDTLPNIPPDFDSKGFKNAMDGLLAIMKYGKNDVELVYNEDKSHYHINTSNPNFKLSIYKEDAEKLLDNVTRLLNGELFNLYNDSLSDGDD